MIDWTKIAITTMTMVMTKMISLFWRWCIISSIHVGDNDSIDNDDGDKNEGNDDDNENGEINDETTAKHTKNIILTETWNSRTWYEKNHDQVLSLQFVLDLF